MPGLLAVVDVNGTPVFLNLLSGSFDGTGTLALSGITPPGLSGLTVDFLGLGIAATGGLGLSNVVEVLFP